MTTTDPPTTAELQPPVTTCGCPTCREHCVHPMANRQYDRAGLTFFCTRCGGVSYA